MTRMRSPTRLLKPHRFARITLWARTVLAWLVFALFSDAAHISRRRIRQRCRFAALDRIERLVRALAVIRAAELAGLRKPSRRVFAAAAPAGFRRRIKGGALLRAAVGARFRKALKHRIPCRRIQRLLAALADIDALARRCLVRRVKRGLARLCAVVPVTPPAHVVFSLAPLPPRAADSS